MSMTAAHCWTSTSTQASPCRWVGVPRGALIGWSHFDSAAGTEPWAPTADNVPAELPAHPLPPPCCPLQHLQGYDLTEEPDFWPPVVDTPQGRRIVTTMET